MKRLVCMAVRLLVEALQGGGRFFRPVVNAAET